jgi:O-antigen/teichoic acid export membrane protein
MKSSSQAIVNYTIKKILSRTKKDSHLGELLSGSFIALSLRIVGIVFGYVLTLLISRNFGAGAMGIFALSATVLSMLAIVGRLGFDTAILKFVAEYTAQNRQDLVKEVYYKALKVVLPFSLAISIALFFLSPYIAVYIFHKEHLSPYFRVASVGIVPLVLKLINAQALRSVRRIREFSFFQNVANVFFASVFLVLLLPFPRMNLFPVEAHVASLILGAVLSQIAWKKYARLDAEPNNNLLRIPEIMHVSLPMMFTSSMFFVMYWTDTLMLGMFRTEAEVGIFNVAVKIASAVSFPLVTINSISASKFAELHSKKDLKGLRKIVKQSTKLIFWTSLPIAATILLFPSFILGVVGKEFQAGVFTLCILAVGQFVNAISGGVGPLLNMTGRQKAFRNIIISASLLNVLLNVLLIPKYGGIGAAFASMASVVAWNIACVIYIKSYLDVVTIHVPFLSRE